MIEAIFLIIMVVGSIILYQWIRTQRHPWRTFLLSLCAVAGIFGFVGSRIYLGHGNVVGWQLGLVLAAICGFVILVIWASNGGRWS